MQGFDLGKDSFGPIIGWRIGEAEAALRAAAFLRDEGVLAQAIRPPTVPEGGSRLRLTLHAGLSDGDLQRLEALLLRCRDLAASLG